MANQNIFSHVNRHFRRRIGSGIAALIPIGFTLFILHFLFDSITAIVLPVAKPFTGTLPYYAVALISLAATFLFVYLCGLVAAHIAGQKMLAAGEALILKVPVAKSIYAASKQMVHVLAGGTTSSFQEVVVYDFPRPGNKAVGFVTGSIKDQSSGLKYLNVFTPATPNPTTGFLVLVPETGVTFTDVSIEEGMRMIISGGVLTPASLASVERQKKKKDQYDHASADSHGRPAVAVLGRGGAGPRLLQYCAAAGRYPAGDWIDGGSVRNQRAGNGGER